MATRDGKAESSTPFGDGGNAVVVEKPAPEILLNGLPAVNHHSLDENNVGFVVDGKVGSGSEMLQHDDVVMVNEVSEQQQSSLQEDLTAVKEESTNFLVPAAMTMNADPQHAQLFNIFHMLASDTDNNTVKLLQQVSNYVYGDKTEKSAGKTDDGEKSVKTEPENKELPSSRVTPLTNSRRSVQRAVRRLLIPSAAASTSSSAAEPSLSATGSSSAAPPMLLNALSILHRTADRNRKDDDFKQRNDHVLDDVMDTGEVSYRLALVRLPIKMLDAKIQVRDPVKLPLQQKTTIDEQGGNAQKRLAVELPKPPPTKSLELERKYIKMKTANFYKRDNYNMLREASEGFSSLLYDLIICKPSSSNQPQQIKSTIIDHVGYYEIDCFKVLELSLMACLFNVNAVDMVIEYAALVRPEPSLLARFACRPMSFIANFHGLTPTSAKTAASKTEISSSASRPSPVRGANRETSRDRAATLMKPPATVDATVVDSGSSTADSQQTTDERDQTKAALYENAGVLLARLIESELLSFDHIMSYVNELEEKALVKIWNEAQEDARQYADNLTSTILSAVSSGTADGGGSGGGNDADDFDASAATDNKDRRKKASRFQLTLSLNLKVQIASAFLQHWHIDLARNVVDLRQASAYFPIARCLSEMLMYSVDLLYRDAALAVRQPGYYFSSQQLQPVYTPFRPNYVSKFYRFSSSTSNSSSMQQLLPPQLTSVAQLDSLSPILAELNANLYIDCVCMHRLLLVVENHFIREKSTNSSFTVETENNFSATNFKEWIAWLFEICLLPAMSLTHCNVSLANALWQCGLQYLPYEIRFLLYHRWAEFGYASHPELCRVRGEVRADLKYAVKRLSKDKKSMEKFGRLLAKLSTCHPVLAHPYVLSRVESFGELTPIIVESFKYQFSMSLDALQFCMISYLADPIRAGVKHDKLAIRPWFLYLCEFLAQATRKVPVDMCGVLHFVVAELKDGKTVDLLVLKKLIEKISGIESSDDLTDEQLQALTGGTVLQQEIFCAQSFRVSRKVTNRFREALIGEDLTLPLALLMVMQKNREIYAVADDKHLKLVGTMYDMCHDTLTQFCVYLSHIFTPQDYAATMPSLPDLCIQFKVPPDIALYLLRPLFFQTVKDELTALESSSSAVAGASAMSIQASSSSNNLLLALQQSSAAAKMLTVAAPPAPVATDDLESLVFSKPVATPTLPPTHTSRGSSSSVVATQNAHANSHHQAAVVVVDLAVLQQAQQFFDRWQQKLQPTAAAIRPLIRQIVTDVSPQFFVLFWTLSPYDLYVPTAAYDTTMSTLNENLNADEHKSSHDISSKRRKEREKIRSTLAELRAEKTRQLAHVQRVMHCLRRWSEAQLFIDSSKTRKNDFILQFIQVCLFPRCMFAPEEARFCAQFIQTIHDLRTPFFSTVICYDRVLCDIRGMLMSCSEKEASRFGRMLRAALDTVMRWWEHEKIFDKECRGHPGFVTKVRSSTVAPTNATSSGGSVDDEDSITYENYRHLVYKWHFKITKTMVDCIESRDYMQVRNALTILTHLVPHFPKILNFYVSLEKKVDALRVQEDKKHANRPDLFALATSYSSRLKAQKEKCVSEEKFHTKAAATTSAAAVAAAAGEAGKKPVERAAGAQNAASSVEQKKSAVQPSSSSKVAEQQAAPKTSSDAAKSAKSATTTSGGKTTTTDTVDASKADHKTAAPAKRRNDAGPPLPPQQQSAAQPRASQEGARKSSTISTTSLRTSSTSPVTSGGDRRTNKNDASTSSRRENKSAVNSPESAAKQSSSSSRAQRPSSRESGGAGTKRDDGSTAKRSSSRADDSSTNNKRSATTAVSSNQPSKQQSSSNTSGAAQIKTGSGTNSGTSQQQSSARPAVVTSQQQQVDVAAQRRASGAAVAQQPTSQQQQQRPVQQKRTLEHSQSSSSTGVQKQAAAKQQHASSSSTSSSTGPVKKLKSTSDAAAGKNAVNSVRGGAASSRPQQQQQQQQHSTSAQHQQKVRNSRASQDLDFSSDEDEKPAGNSNQPPADVNNTHSRSAARQAPPPMQQPSRTSVPSQTDRNVKPPPQQQLQQQSRPSLTSSSSTGSSGRPPVMPPPRQQQQQQSQQPPLPPPPSSNRRVAPPPAPAGQPPASSSSSPSSSSLQRRTSTGDAAGRTVVRENVPVGGRNSNNMPPAPTTTTATRTVSISGQNNNNNGKRVESRSNARPLPPPPPPPMQSSSSSSISKKSSISAAPPQQQQQHEDIDDDEDDDDFDISEVFDQA